MISLQHVHPIILHFPIVLTILLPVFDALLLARGHTPFGGGFHAKFSTSLAVLAGVTAVAAYFFGDMALDMAVQAGFPEAQLEIHETLGTISAAVLASWALVRAFLWWRNIALNRRRAWLAVGCEASFAGLIIVTAYFGGRLVYELGVGVARAAGTL